MREFSFTVGTRREFQVGLELIMASIVPGAVEIKSRMQYARFSRLHVRDLFGE